MSDVTIRRVSFFIWKDKRLTHVEESLRIVPPSVYPEGYPVSEESFVSDDRSKLMNKLKEKYGGSLSHIRKVWCY